MIPCVFCDWWDTDSLSWDKLNGMEYEPESVKEARIAGQCHKYAPRECKIGRMHSWPSTFAHDWCGDASDEGMKASPMRDDEDAEED